MPSCAEVLEVEEPSESLKRTAEDDPDWHETKRLKVKKRIFPCQFADCGRIFYRPCRLQEHLNSHTGESSFQCDKCDKSFKKASRLAAHKKIHQPNKKFECSFPDCTVACTTTQHLKIHELMHTTPNPYQCTDYPPCTASFRKKYLLRAHISEEHTHIPAFPCPYTEEGCQRAFTIQSKLTSHIKARHTINHFCDECGQGFQVVLDLKRHKNKEHPPRCFTCGIEFTSKDSLVKHLQVHKTSLEERKKFLCEVEGCGKRYTKPFALKLHVQTVHEKSKPFVCEWEGCGQSFGFKKVLQRHLLTHTQPAPPRERKKTPKQPDLLDELAGIGEDESRKIPCSVEGCDYRFMREYDLQRHLAALHKDIQNATEGI